MASPGTGCRRVRASRAAHSATGRRGACQLGTYDWPRTPTKRAAHTVRPTTYHSVDVKVHATRERVEVGINEATDVSHVLPAGHHTVHAAGVRRTPYHRGATTTHIFVLSVVASGSTCGKVTLG